jgi:uncharacterized membrane protein
MTHEPRHRPLPAAAVLTTLALALPTAAHSQAASPAETASPPPVTVLQCTGNEPFWRLDIGPGTALLRRPGTESVEATTFTGSLDSMDYLSPPWHVWHGVAASGSDAGPAEKAEVVAVVREETCRDTMADVVHDARAVVVLPGGRTATGCCTKRGPLADEARAGEDGTPFADFGGKRVTDWSRVLPDLLPAVQACVSQATPSVESVLKAWPMNRGMVGARLKTSDGGVHDCTATTGGKVDSLAPIAADAEPLPGEGEPVFLPTYASPPEVDCGRLERVSGPQGEAVAGYLHYTAGCAPKKENAN